MKETTETQPTQPETQEPKKLFKVKEGYCVMTGMRQIKSEWCRTSTKIQPLIFKTGKR